jgi:hypothetical protein
MRLPNKTRPQSKKIGEEAQEDEEDAEEADEETKPPLFTLAPGLPTDPSSDRDRRPACRPRPAEGFPVLDGLLCAISAPDLNQCPTLLRLLSNWWTRDGWQDPLKDQEDAGPDTHPWGAYGLFDHEEFADRFRGD